MKNAELIQLQGELSSLSGKQLPISLELAKNLKKISKFKEEYVKELDELARIYAKQNEKGEFIDKDGKVVNNVFAMQIDKREEFNEKFIELQNKEIELELVSVKGSKKMYDSESKTDVEIAKYLSRVLNANELLLLDAYGIVEDILD